MLGAVPGAKYRDDLLDVEYVCLGLTEEANEPYVELRRIDNDEIFTVQLEAFRETTRISLEQMPQRKK